MREKEKERESKSEREMPRERGPKSGSCPVKCCSLPTCPYLTHTHTHAHARARAHTQWRTQAPQVSSDSCPIFEPVYGGEMLSRCVGVGVGAWLWGCVVLVCFALLCSCFFTHPRMEAVGIISFGPTLAHALHIFLVLALSPRKDIHLRVCRLPSLLTPSSLPLYLSKRCVASHRAILRSDDTCPFPAALASRVRCAA